MDIEEQLGARLRSLREQRGWSLGYIAEVCGTSGPHISKIERGLVKEYSLKLLAALAGAYGMKLPELIAPMEAPEGLSPVEAMQRDLIDAFRSMPDDRQETLWSVAMTLRPPRV